MKKLIILSGFVLLELALNSCTPENSNDGKKYYKFVNSDKDLIINYNYVPDQVITYENQSGTQLHFKVIANESKKEGKYSGSFWGSYTSLEYYYDSRIIRLEIVENQNNFTNNQIIYSFSKSEDKFKNAVNFPIWNVTNNYFLDEMDRPFNISSASYNYWNKNQMTINGHLFNRVVTINSNDNSVLQSYYGGVLPKNVNKVFYDYDFGIIEFDDIDGNTWKVNYP